ncbi:MAG TPA: thiol-activated cytolysin family protein [Gemmataceae bacterium]|jgi:hypothetical protein
MCRGLVKWRACGIPGLFVLLLTAACELPLTAADEEKDRAELRNFVLKMTSFEKKEPVPLKQTGDSKSHEEDGVTVQTTPFETTLTLDELAGFNPNHGVLWPGSLIQGGTLRRGTLAAVPVPHARQTVVIGSVAEGSDPAPISKVIDNPSLATVEQARQDILRGGFLPAPKFSFTMQQVYSLEHALLQIGARASWMSGNIAASLNSEQYSSQTNIMVKFTQEYYSYSVEPPAQPTAFFREGVKVKDLEPYANQEDNPITYIQTVTYGRMALLMISSKESYDKLSLDVKGSIGYVGGSAEASATEAKERLIKESDMKLIVFGGKPDSALEIVTGDPLERFKAFVAEKVTPETIRFGLPISFRLNYLRDNRVAGLSFTTAFSRVDRTGVPRLTNWSITFYTQDEDKDKDTHLSVKVYQPGVRDIVFYEQEGLKYYPNNSPNTEVLKDIHSVFARDVGKLRVRISIHPHGNDTWRFKYKLEARRSDGGTFTYLFPGVIELNENSRVREYPLPPPSMNMNALAPGAINLSSDPLVGDFNGDGKCDIALRNRKTWMFYFRRGDGKGKFDKHDWASYRWEPDRQANPFNFTFFQAIAGDFDGDGKCDIALRNANTGLFYFRRGDGKGGFDKEDWKEAWAPYQWQANLFIFTFFQAIAGDFDGDGKCDIALRNVNTGVFYFRRGDGKGKFNTPDWPTFQWQADGPGNAYQAIAGDFDGDGKCDIALRNANTGEFFFRRGDGTGKFSTQDWAVLKEMKTPE